MKAEFIGESKHYTTGKVYNIRSKLRQTINYSDNSIENVFGANIIRNVIAVYNVDDEAALYKMENTSIAHIDTTSETPIAMPSQPYRVYTSIEDFLKDWKVIEV